MFWAFVRFSRIIVWEWKLNMAKVNGTRRTRGQKLKKTT